MYWFYPIKLSARQTGYDLPEATFRDWVSQALEAEGLRIGPWQRCILPAQSIFHDKVGYGHGSPWSDPSYKGDVTYEPADYPVAQMVADQTTWLSNMFFWPQTADEVQHAITTFEKVFGQLDAVIGHFQKDQPSQ